MLILTKSIFAIMIGFLSSVILGLFIIPLLKKINIRQNISVFVGEAHRAKSGTPTMGGLIFILPTVLVTLGLVLLNKLEMNWSLGIILLVFVCYGLIGFLDDYLSVKNHKNEGLKDSQKLLAQVLVSILFFYIYIKNGGQTALVVSTLGINIEMGWIYGLFILFVLVGASNAVNLTDGLDGLAGSLATVALIAFALISLMVGYTDIGIFTLVLVGSIMGFLIYNMYPAKVFMGDTGSLALGAVMASIAIIVHRELTLLAVAFVFVIETLSVILQVIWMFLFHKKLFLMTPLHHHFEKLGWSEPDIVKLFLVIGLIFAMAGIFFGVWL